MSNLPEPRLKQLDDETGLTTFQFMKMTPGREFCDVVVVKASFDMLKHGLDRKPSAGTLCLADTHRIAQSPMTSSLAESSDLILGKPGADIFVTGSARIDRPLKWWGVGVGVGPVDQPLAKYECAVSGPRVWQCGLLGGWKMSDPAVTQSVPIQYELAWGGHKPDPKKDEDEWDHHELNPCGSGFNFSAYKMSDTPKAPQWESNSLIFKKPPEKDFIGLGPVPRFWLSRSKYAGTYDKAWREQFDAGQPDFAKDFDMRFFQAAHPSLQTKDALVGDEEIRLRGLLPMKEPWHATLPRWAIVASFGNQKAKLRLDTVHIDLDAFQFHLVWRMTLPHSNNITQAQLNLGKL
jgi:hypothetical protein